MSVMRMIKGNNEMSALNIYLKRVGSMSNLEICNSLNYMSNNYLL